MSSNDGTIGADTSWLVNTSFPAPPPGDIIEIVEIKDEGDRKRKKKHHHKDKDKDKKHKKHHRHHHRGQDAVDRAKVPSNGNDGNDMSVVPVVEISSSSEGDESEDERERRKKRARKKDKKREKKDKKHHRDKDKHKTKLTDKQKILQIERQIAISGVLPSTSIPAPPTGILARIKGDDRAGGEGNDADEEKKYFEDFQGDKNNVLYFYPNPTTVPRYPRYFTTCLGLPLTERLIPKKDGYHFNFTKNDGGEIDVISAAAMNRYMNPKFRGLLKTETKFNLSNRGKPVQPTKKQSTTNDFIPIDGEKESTLAALAEEDEKQERERIIDDLMQRARDYNNKMKDNPYDVQLWLDYANFQDEFVCMGTKQPSTVAGTTLEKKISIYEKALESNPNSIPLLLAYLSAAEQRWETDKVSDLWDKVIRNHAQVLALWDRYIKFKQSNFASFTVSSVRETYTNAIKTLREKKMILKRKDPINIQTNPEARQLENTLLELFYRFCVLEKQSGYLERSIAYFQSLTEFNVFQPKHLVTYKERSSFFKAFWESEASRVGEDNSLGWDSWFDLVSKGGTPPTAKVKTEEKGSVPKEEPNDELTIYDRWYKLETQTEKDKWLPAKIDDSEKDAEDESDPDRVVLYDDIADVLFEIDVPEHKLRLFLSLLEFVGLHVPNLRSTNDDHIKNRAEELEDPTNFFNAANEKRQHWDGNCLTTNMFIQDPRRAKFIRNCLALATKVFQDHLIFAKVYLEFEGRHSPVSSAREVAKSLLKKHNSHLPLWNTYAQNEKNSKNIAEARKVYDMALSMYLSLPKNAQPDVFQLFHSYASMELENNSSPSVVLHILASAAEGTQFSPLYGKTGIAANVAQHMSPTRVLKARKAYEQKTATMSKNESSFAHLTICFSLFEYLAQGFDYACKIFEDAAKATADNPRLCEQILTEYVKLLIIHSRRQPTPPRLLRETLLFSLKKFPRNSVFLMLFVESEIKSHIENRIRRTLDDLCEDEKSDSPIVWMVSIQSEVSKLGAEHRIRSLFERAVRRHRACPIIWRAYLSFEVARGTGESAKRVYFRAVRDVPWCKKLWMDCVSLQKGAVSDQELKTLIDIMSEKELRIRKNLDGTSFAAVEDEASDEESSDESDREARERRKEREYKRAREKERERKKRRMHEKDWNRDNRASDSESDYSSYSDSESSSEDDRRSQKKSSAVGRDNSRSSSSNNSKRADDSDSDEEIKRYNKERETVSKAMPASTSMSSTRDTRKGKSLEEDEESATAKLVNEIIQSVKLSMGRNDAATATATQQEEAEEEDQPVDEEEEELDFIPLGSSDE